MAYIVDEYDDDVMHASTHGMVSREDMSFLKGMSERLLGRGPREFTNRYLGYARDTLERFDFDLVRRKVSAIRDRYKRRFNVDDITLLSTIQDVQSARPQMRKYIMASPRIRDLYQKGRIEGYGDLYEDLDPTVKTAQYEPYREVNNGSYVGDDEHDAWITHLEVADEYGDENLSHMEKVIIRRGWKAISDWIDENGEDPTSLAGAQL